MHPDEMDALALKLEREAVELRKAAASLRDAHRRAQQVVAHAVQHNRPMEAPDTQPAAKLTGPKPTLKTPLRLAMIEAGLSNQALADRLKVNLSTVAAWVSGRSHPTKPGHEKDVRAVLPGLPANAWEVGAKLYEREAERRAREKARGAKPHQ